MSLEKMQRKGGTEDFVPPRRAGGTGISSRQSELAAMKRSDVPVTGWQLPNKSLLRIKNE
jgi:hypothetical protein